jgi:hypothetical protein
MTATQPARRISSCKLQRQNRRAGFLPASCSGKTGAPVFFPQVKQMSPLRVASVDMTGMGALVDMTGGRRDRALR